MPKLLLRFLLLLLLAALVACSPSRRGSSNNGDDDDDDSASGDDDDDATGDDDDDDATGDDDDATGCAEILETSPEPGDSNVFGDRVTVTWDAVPQDGGITVETSGGSSVSGSMSDDDNGRTLIFTADSPFGSDSTFTVTITQDCASDVPYEFSTGPYGDSVSNQSNLIGRVFNIDLASATFVEPAGVGALLQGYLTDTYILFNATADSDLAGGEMHVLGATGELDGGDIEQDWCAETLPFTYGPDAIAGTSDDEPADWQNPTMDLTAGELALSMQGVDTVIQDLQITATFHPQLSDFVGGTFAGLIDTRSMIGLLDSEDPNAMCDLVQSTVGVSCVDCGDGEEFCLQLVAENVSGSWQSQISGITPRSCADIILDNSCENDPWTTDGSSSGPIDPSLCPEYAAIGR